MVYAPETQSGGYFNDQERDVTSLQWVEALSLSRDLWRGQHVFKFGTDLQQSNYDGTSVSRPVEIRRLDGSLAERTDFGGIVAAEGGRHGVRGVRAGSLAPQFAGDLRVRPAARSRRGRRAASTGRRAPAWPSACCRRDAASSAGGYGKFVQRTPLNVDAFPSFEPRTVTRFAADGAPLGTVDAVPTASTALADTGGPRRQRRVGSAVRPPCSAEAGVSRTPGHPRVHPQPDSGGRGAAPVEHRHVALQGARSDGALPRRRSARPDAVVRVVARAPPISTTTISSTATSAIRSSAPTRTT